MKFVKLVIRDEEIISRKINQKWQEIIATPKCNIAYVIIDLRAAEKRKRILN